MEFFLALEMINLIDKAQIVFVTFCCCDLWNAFHSRRFYLTTYHAKFTVADAAGIYIPCAYFCLTGIVMFLCPVFAQFTSPDYHVKYYLISKFFLIKHRFIWPVCSVLVCVICVDSQYQECPSPILFCHYGLSFTFGFYYVTDPLPYQPAEAPEAVRRKKKRVPIRE